MKTSTIGRPRTKPAEVRRDELMDAAQALFLRKGFAATNVSEVVEEAGVAKGTFYLYFKTKEEVLAALRDRFVDDFCRMVDPVITGAYEDWPKRIDAWVEACVDAYLDNVELHDLVFHEYSPSKREMKADNPVVTRLALLLGEGVQAGAWSVVHPQLTAVMLFDSLHGAIDNNLASNTPMSRPKLTQAVTAFYRNALSIDRA
jgi:AcrR family transcriptional regulator